MKGIFTVLVLILSFLTLKNFYFDTYQCDKFKVTSNLKYHTIIFNNESTNFSVTQNKQNFDFWINSNFFENSNAIGGLVIDNRVINKQLPLGGSFVVNKGKPQIKFTRVKRCEHLSQSLVWGIKDGQLNNSLLNETLQKEKTAKILIGTNQWNQVVVIHTNFLVWVDMSQFLNFALSQGLTQAIVLDSGSSIDLGLSYIDYYHSIQTIPSFVKPILGFKEPVSFITAKFI